MEPLGPQSTTYAADLERQVFSFPHPPGHAAAWESLIAATERYPPGKFIPPWKAPKRPEKAATLAYVQLWCIEREAPLAPIPVRLRVDFGDSTVDIGVRDAEEAADRFAAIVCHPNRNGTLYVWADFARRGAHILLRHWAPRMVATGYAFVPFASGAAIKTLRVTSGRNHWTISDAAITTGSAASSLGDVKQLQDYALEHFNVGLRPTIGGTAIRAAARFLPPGDWMWRPSPLLVAMCRTGGAFRGGYSYGEPYRGPLYTIDRNRSYTAALCEPLALRSAFGQFNPRINHGHGIWLCTIRGNPKLPPYLAVWFPQHAAWVKDNWTGGTCIAAVPSTEFDGLRALGLSVEPGYGFGSTWTTSLAPYVNHLEMLTVATERGTVTDGFLKMMGNCVWGKLAQRPQLEQLCYNGRRPDDSWLTFVGSDGNVCEGVYVRQSVRHGAAQHVDGATAIAGAARAALYVAASRAMARGTRIVRADTDALGAVAPFPPEEATGGRRIGEWRATDSDHDGLVVGRRGYAVGQSAKLVGSQRTDRAAIELMWQGGVWTVAGTMMRPPWIGGPHFRPLVRQFRADYSTSANVYDCPAEQT